MPQFRRNRPKILVSVRNAVEARVALSFHVDIIDIKEPTHGPLGKAENQTIEDVLQSLSPNPPPLSLALGELSEDSWLVVSELLRSPLMEQVSYVKFGLAGCATSCLANDWPKLWLKRLALLPTNVEPVAVAYADHTMCGAPAVGEVIHQSVCCGCRYLLLDTYTKTEGDIFQMIGENGVKSAARLARNFNIQFALAGSIQPTNLATALNCGPDIIAIRGAACRANDRNATICAEKLGNFVEQCSVLKQDKILDNGTRW
jgi:uncharacterized protein (UPF0264 family)